MRISWDKLEEGGLDHQKMLDNLDLLILTYLLIVTRESYFNIFSPRLVSKTWQASDVPLYKLWRWILWRGRRKGSPPPQYRCTVERCTATLCLLAGVLQSEGCFPLTFPPAYGRFSLRGFLGLPDLILTSTVPLNCHLQIVIPTVETAGWKKLSCKEDISYFHFWSSHLLRGTHGCLVFAQVRKNKSILSLEIGTSCIFNSFFLLFIVLRYIFVTWMLHDFTCNCKQFLP